MATSTTVPSSGNQDIDGILDGSKFTTKIFTYRFTIAASEYGAPYGSSLPNNEPFHGFAAVTPAQETAIKAAFNYIKAYTGATFTEVTDITATPRADLRFGRTDDGPNWNLTLQSAWAYTPDGGSEDPNQTFPGLAGDVWFTKGLQTGSAPDRGFDDPFYGSGAFTAGVLHEIGHALGLKHGQDPAGFGTLPPERNTIAYSIMTYPTYLGDTNPEVLARDLPTSYMQDDIAALQYLYGVNYSYHGNDTTYTWTPDSGVTKIDGVAQGTPRDESGNIRNVVFETIWDGGGNDTYDFSAFVDQDLTIDLSTGGTIDLGGQYADVGNDDGNLHLQAWNIANSLRAPDPTRAADRIPENLIENVKSGAGDDRIHGNEGDNNIDGGAGTDTVEFDGKLSDYSIVVLPDPLNAGGKIVTVKGKSAGLDHSTDTLTNIEVIHFRGDNNSLLTQNFKIGLVASVTKAFDAAGTDSVMRALDGGGSGTTARGVSSFATLAAPSGLPALTQLPIIGAKIQEEVEKLQIEDKINLFKNVRDKILDAIASIPDSGGTAGAQALATAINNIPSFSFGTLQAQAAPGSTVVHLFITAQDALTFDSNDLTNLAVDIGNDTFGFNASVDAHAALTGQLKLALDLDINTGDVTVVDDPNDPTAKEVTLGLDAGVALHGADGSGNATANFGAVGLQVGDFVTPAGSPVTPHNFIDLDFALDLAPGAVEDITTDSFDLSIDGTANLGLHFTTTTPTDLLPTIAGNLVVNWAASTTEADGLGTIIEFQGVTLDLGDLVKTLKKVFAPILDAYDTYPLGAMIDAVTGPLPVIDSLARKAGFTSYLDLVPEGQKDGKLSLLDVAMVVAKIQGDPDAVADISKFAEALATLDSVVGSGAGDTLAPILLGNFTVFNSADSASMARGFSLLAANNGPTITPDPNNPNAQAAADKEVKDHNIFQDTEDRPGLPVFSNSPLNDGFSDKTGFSIPLLVDPTNAIKVLLNSAYSEPVPLIEYDLPALRFGARYTKYFPVVGPISVVLDGGFNGYIDFAVGYDTKGLKFDPSLSVDASNFEDGFYFTTQPLLPGGVDREPVARLDLAIGAGVGLSIGVAQAGVTGQIGADLQAHLNDPVGDGKLRLVDLGNGCYFDPVEGRFYAGLALTMKFGWGPFSWTRRITLADTTLADFSFGCKTDSSEMGGLATLGSGVDVTLGTLRLNVGGGDKGAPHTNDFANARHSVIAEYATDINENYAIRNAVGTDGHLIAGALDVRAFTVIETYGSASNPVQVITGDFGLRNDSLIIDADVMVRADVHGGDGDDLLVGGGGNDKLYGDDGYDVLQGGAGDDELYGGNNDDTLEGGAGADRLDGGSEDNNGYDQVTYENSAVGVRFRPDSAHPDQFIGSGGEAEGDRLINIEYVIGSHFDDSLYANPNKNGTLEGLDGDDTLIGGDGRDLLIGGPGADRMFGFANEDGVSYLTSEGGVQIDLRLGRGYGGDAEGDLFDHIEDIQGSAFDDELSGNSGKNEIDAWFGDDIVYGGGDGDVLDGGEGHDLLSYARRTSGGIEADLSQGYAIGQGGNHLDPLAIQDTIKTAKDIDQVGHPWSSFEDLEGTNLANKIDQLTGDDRANTIRGLRGTDIINGLGGDDILVGGEGSDALDGGDGIDLADYRDASAGVIVSLIDGYGSAGEALGDTLVNIENLRGSDFVDQLIGDDLNNVIDPGLSQGAYDMVEGRGGTDTLQLDYSRSDFGTGIEGGFDANADSGAFTRLVGDPAGTVLDQVKFTEIERLNIIATSSKDVIVGGSGDDFVDAGDGDDVIYTGGKDGYSDNVYVGTFVGADVIFAGAGDDLVVHNHGADLQLATKLLDSTVQSLPLVFRLDGGAGTDTLSISLANRSDDIVLGGNAGVNMNFADGSVIVNFEVLGDVITGSGKDTVTQSGVHDNKIITGLGEDIITPGLGVDFVDGGLDFRTDPDSGIVIDFANGGDLLVLDYSTIGDTGGVNMVATRNSSPLGQTDPRFQFFSFVNAGTAIAGSNTLTYTDIERIHLTGSAFGDVIYGTENYGMNGVGSSGSLPAVPGVNSSLTLRGADILDGGDGDDALFGLSGSDAIDGGLGDDRLVGANGVTYLSGNHAYADNRPDQAEVDTLTGGAGADLFELGSNNGFYYGYTGGDGSDANRAIITDFNAAEGDQIQLWDKGAYETQSNGQGGLNLYFLPGDGDRQWIAEFQNLTSLDLSHGGGTVVYVDENTPAAFSARGASSANFISLASASVPQKTAMVPGPFGVIPHEMLAPVVADQEVIARGVTISPRMSGDTTTSKLTTLEAPTLAPVTNWINPLTSVNDLKALFSGATGITVTKVTTQGSSTAFGTFTGGDPFGLGSGIVASTGKAADLVGPNTEDGGLNGGAPTPLNFSLITSYFNAAPTARTTSNFYVADLGALSPNSPIDINSLTFTDSNAANGGAPGDRTGFDLDAVFVSPVLLTKAQLDAGFDINTLQHLNIFDFSAGSIQYRPGAWRPTDQGGIYDNPGHDFLGARNGIVLNPANLGVADAYHSADDDTSTGVLTLGDGGSVGFNLSQTLTTTPGQHLYLYVVEDGGAENLVGAVKASSNRLDSPADLSTDFGTPGTTNDKTTIEYTLDAPNGADQEVVFQFVVYTEELAEFAGSAFNDTVKIKLNGANLAALNDGSALTINNLMLSPEGPPSADLILNPVGTGPLASQIKADAYTVTLTFRGQLKAGENKLSVELTDVGDGAVDTGIVLKSATVITSNEAPHFINEPGDGIVIFRLPEIQPDVYYSGNGSIQDVIVEPDGSIITAGGYGGGMILPNNQGIIGVGDIVFARLTAGGFLDPVVNGVGFVSRSVSDDVSQIDDSVDFGANLARQSDGTYIVAGGTRFIDQPPDIDPMAYMLRFKADGTIDQTFGNNGRVLTHLSDFLPISQSAVTNMGATDVLVLPDDKILLSASWNYQDSTAQFGMSEGSSLIRYNVDGSVDDTFGTHGAVSIDSADFIHVAQQADGGYLALGYPHRGDYEFRSLYAFNADGTVDQNFGTNGVQVIDISAVLPTDETKPIIFSTDFVVGADGKIYISFNLSKDVFDVDGNYVDTTSAVGFVVFDPNGTQLSVSYGAGEISGAYGRWFDTKLALQPDGSVVIAGVEGGGEIAALGAARFKADGSIDTGFGNNGFISTPLSPVAQLGNVIVQPDGKILIVGALRNLGDDGSSGQALVRLTADGQFDRDFDGTAMDDGGIAARGGPAIVLDDGVAVIDPELKAANAYTGAILTLERLDGANPEDVFGAGGNATISNGHFIVGGVDIGTTSSANGRFSITFNSAATQALVDAALSSLTYANTGNGNADTIRILWTFADGSGPSAKSTLGTTSVYVFSAPIDPDQVLVGGPGPDPLVGGTGNDVLNGLGGADTMSGGPGNDTYHVDDPGDVVTENVGEGIDTIVSTIALTLAANVENLVLAGSASNGIGNGLDNYILGNGGDNTLEGGLGNDTLSGGLGNDTASYAHSSVGVSVNLEGNGVWQATGGAGDDFLESIENLTGSNLADTLIGDAGDNTLIGLDGDDVIYGNAGKDNLQGGQGNDALNGGLGADYMEGGDGDDTYYVDNAGDAVAEAAGALTGTDTVVASIDYVLAANVENLVLGGAAGLRATGNDLDNFILGNAGDNILEGGLGNDGLHGGAGYDTVTYEHSGLSVHVNLELNGSWQDTGGAGGDFLESIENLTGSNFDDTLIGDAGVNVLFGLDGNDIIYGNAGSDAIYGGLGNDQINGGQGVDTMAGGTGDDIYFVDDAADVVTEAAGEGTDTVVSSASFTLGAEIENLVLQGTAALSGSGNDLDNYLQGNDGANTLSGGIGRDVLVGGAGIDILTGGADTDVFIFNAFDLDGQGNEVTDFVSGTDKLGFVASDFGFAAGSTIGIDDLVLGTSATQGHGQFLFDQSTHTLSWDADGTGAGTAIKLATLTGTTTLTHDDFLLV